MTNRQKAARAVDAIITDLSDRRGLRHEWDQIDDDIKREIRHAWIAAVIEAFAVEKP